MAVQPELHHGERSVPLVAWISSGISFLSIWVAVTLSSMLAPDVVSGSQHEHLQLAWGDWVWGLVATSFVVLAILDGIRRHVASPTPWWALAGGVAAIWIGVTLLSIFGPVTVTGTDPTTIPLVAMGAPILGVFLTWFVCTIVKAAFEQES